jgi:hypothetical protein
LLYRFVIHKSVFCRPHGTMKSQSEAACTSNTKDSIRLEQWPKIK